MIPPELDLFKRLQGAVEVKPTVPTEGSAVEKDMQKVDPEFSTPLSLRNLFTHPETHPLVLDFALLKEFGVEWYGWTEETLFGEITRAFRTTVSQHNRHKIQAVKTLHTVLLPWESWQVFEKVLQALNGNVPRFDLMQAPTLAQLMAGVDMMSEIRQEEFADEVKLYAASAILHEDVFFCPPPLDIFQAEVSQPHWVCRDCGSEDSALQHDGFCDTCTGKFDPERGFSFTPDPEKLAKGLGKNMDLVLRYDPDSVEHRWAEVALKTTESVELQETSTDVQVARLLMARDYTNIRRRQLAEQLTSLKSWLGA